MHQFYVFVFHAPYKRLENLSDSFTTHVYHLNVMYSRMISLELEKRHCFSRTI